jgi:uncharacterized protein involved in exopolysaccharide biosynthesis
MQQEDTLTIDFKALFKILRSKKWIIMGISLLFTFVGAWYAFTAQEEFISQGKILPEIQGGNSSPLGGLANLVGIGGFELGMKNNTDAIRPDIYPDILKSTPFFLELFKQTIITKDGDKISFMKFYHSQIEENEVIEKNKIVYFKGKPSGVILLNKIDEQRIKNLKERINASIDKKSGIISISVKMPDPVVAACIARFSIDYITDYVTDYRTEKARKEVDFLGEKVALSKGKFYATQEKKAKYSDQFAAPTIRLQTADVQRERIESEYKISASFYNELLKKYEEAKIKLQQETPVFKVYEPPVVPTLKSEPKRSLIIISFMTSGFILSSIFFILISKKVTF